ncbi:hypothetical protein [Spirosoma arcticum]
MHEETFLKIRLYFTGAMMISIWLLLIWDYHHGGVPSHHILQRKDMPEFSNWWGGLLLPLLTWFLLYRIQKRIINPKNGNSRASKFSLNILYAFIIALCFGILLSVFFTFGYTEMPLYMLTGLLLLALFLPIYRAECFLGCVIGMTFTFGGVLPIGIVALLTLIGMVLYLLVRPGIIFFTSRFANLVSSIKHK